MFLKIHESVGKIPKTKQVRIWPKNVEYIFIGYENKSSAYRFTMHKSDLKWVKAWQFSHEMSCSLEISFLAKKWKNKVLAKEKRQMTNEDYARAEEPTQNVRINEVSSK